MRSSPIALSRSRSWPSRAADGTTFSAAREDGVKLLAQSTIRDVRPKVRGNPAEPELTALAP
jgi:hypothetical protein